MPAAERARWLAELSEALRDAQELLRRLEITERQWAAAYELYLRIEATRLEVQSLRLSRSLQPRTEPRSKWSDPAPWQSGLG